MQSEFSGIHCQNVYDMILKYEKKNLLQYIAVHF